MINILKKVVVALGGVDTSEKNHVDTFTENIITNITGDKIALTSNGGGIWTEITEIEEYEFLDINVVGFKPYKSFNGAELIFIKDKKEVAVLNSDTKEIVSTHSNVTERYLTSVSFEITNKNLDFLFDRECHKVIFKCNNKQEEFEILK
ncbi:hypothetical protein [Flavobacterium celericrescens]|uniref:Uncharacterized protein n=1 Tax=Flavobacterium celericrescens TaxID=2709780 RepID=A0ABX0IHK7_9FLAO|nr:hypothetical protein [Flavobacterium celericrescens]NHM05112.1 hypothetical protein [Flavobacterium celericrescens]